MVSGILWFTCSKTAVRHAAAFGDVLFAVEVEVPGSAIPIPPTPADTPLPSPFSKGEEYLDEIAPGDPAREGRAIAERPSTMSELATSKFIRLRPNRLHQILLIGSKKKNLRFVTTKHKVHQPQDTPSPSP